MPTACTADVESGKLTDFTTFAWSCSRAMGAFVCARDDVNPKRAPTLAELDTICDSSTSYHKRQLAQAEQTLSTLKNRTPSAWESVYAHYAVSSKKESAEQCDGARTRCRNYQAMLDKVNAWTPPTHEHVGFKDFMVSQLTESMRWSCTERDPEPVLSLEEYKALELSEAERSLRYHIDRLEEALALDKSRREWILTLADSLGTPIVTKPHDKYAGQPPWSAAGWHPDQDGHG